MIILRHPRRFICALATLAIQAAFADSPVAPPRPASLIWPLDRTDVISGQPTTVLGAPRVIHENSHAAAVFDGARDGLILPVNPLFGLAQFTIELLIRPDAHGPAEQRFFHIQDTDGSRCLLEIRLTPDGRWALDTFLLSGKNSLPLLDRTLLHTADEWHWVTLRYDGRKMSSFVDGRPELSGEVAFASTSLAGQTSIGVRLNQVYWFKGAIREIRIHPLALPPAQLAH